MSGIKQADLRFPEVLADRGDGLIKLKRRDVYYLHDKDGVKVIKELKIGAKQAKLVGDLLSDLNGSGITPELIHPKSGAAYFWFKGNRYFITGYLPGRQADYFQVEDLQAAIRTMASFHRLTARFLKSRPGRYNFLKYKPGLVWQIYLHEMEKCRDRAIRVRNRWCRQYLQYWYLFWKQACSAIEEIETEVTEISEVICYHDWAFHNLIINGGAAFLIDFDYIVADHPAHDRANLINRYLRLHQWSNEALLKILWNFDRFYPWGVGDLRRLRIYLTFPYDYWILGRQYLIEQQPWSEKYFQEQWERKVAGWEERLKILEMIKCFE